MAHSSVGGQFGPKSTLRFVSTASIRGLSSFVRFYGGTELDASLLLLPTVGFLPPNDQRIQGTIAAIERRLVKDGLVLRYDTLRSDDGLPPGEGAFLACSFWLVDAYVLLGRLAQAEALYETSCGALE